MFSIAFNSNLDDLIRTTSTSFNFSYEFILPPKSTGMGGHLPPHYKKLSSPSDNFIDETI